MKIEVKLLIESFFDDIKDDLTDDNIGKSISKVITDFPKSKKALDITNYNELIDNINDMNMITEYMSIYVKFLDTFISNILYKSVSIKPTLLYEFKEDNEYISLIVYAINTFVNEPLKRMPICKFWFNYDNMSFYYYRTGPYDIISIDSFGKRNIIEFKKFTHISKVCLKHKLKFKKIIIQNYGIHDLNRLLIVGCKSISDMYKCIPNVYLTNHIYTYVSDINEKCKDIVNINHNTTKVDIDTYVLLGSNYDTRQDVLDFCNAVISNNKGVNVEYISYPHNDYNTEGYKTYIEWSIKHNNKVYDIYDKSFTLNMSYVFSMMDKSNYEYCTKKRLVLHTDFLLCIYELNTGRTMQFDVYENGRIDTKWIKQ